MSNEQRTLGSLFTIAAASGSGKTSLVKALTESIDNIQVSVSHTTRPMRVGEEDGRHYFFVPKQQFLNMIANNEFLENAEVFGHYYGTSKAWVKQRLQAGTDVILEIDWQGSAQIRELFPQSTSIFILPPSLDVLKERLIKRQQDSLDTIDQRLAMANKEISHYKEFDYLIINEDFDHALLDLKAIIKSKRLETCVQLRRYSKILENLLQNQ